MNIASRNLLASFYLRSLLFETGALGHGANRHVAIGHDIFRI